MSLLINKRVSYFLEKPSSP